LCQLHLAHLEAQRIGLQGGGIKAAKRFAKVAASEFSIYQSEFEDKLRGSGRAKVTERTKDVLQEAGYKVELGAMVGGECYVEVLVHHASCPGGVAVNVLVGGSMLRHPRGQVSGKVKLKHTPLRQHCDGLVVLPAAATKLPGLVVRKLEMELKRVQQLGDRASA